MDNKSLAHDARPHPASEATGDLEHVGSIVPRAINPQLLSPRFRRGIALASQRFEEITRIAPWTWSVPSCSGDHRYVVDLKHGLHGLCTCPDHPPAKPGERCKHEHAARYVKAKTATCSGCRERFGHRELVELGEDNHDNLTYFHGDLLCRGCANSSGVLF